MFQTIRHVFKKKPKSEAPAYDWKYNEDTDTFYRYHVETGQIVASCTSGGHGQYVVTLYANGHQYRYIDRNHALRAIESVEIARSYTEDDPL